MVHLKGLLSSTRILLGLIPGLGSLIILRMAIHRYRPDIEDLDNRIQDCSADSMHACYDFIIVGAGSAGAVVASRLSENPSWRVLLLEAGSDENALSDLPVMFPIVQTSSVDWQFTTEPSDGYCRSMVGGRCKWPRGKVLGGSSVLNAMLYVRGNRRDYDYWEELGNPGWSYEKVLPYFKKSEDMRISEHLNDSYHGTGGYLTIENFRYEQPVTKNLLEAAKQLGYEVRDVNGDYQTGFMRSHATVRDGLRCSTAKAFLRPASKRPNLHVGLFSYVEKVLIDEHKKAYGVMFVKDGKEHVVKASKEVILSAGAIQSPQLLMLSGVGDADHLKDVGIYPIHNLTGVGQNLQDHVAMGGHSFLFDNPYKNGTDFCFNINGILTLKALVDFALHKNGPFYSMPECEAMGFVKTKYADPDDDYPDIQLFLAPVADNMDGGLFGKRANGLDDDTYAELYEDILYKQAYSVVPLLLRPKSRGYIKLSDSNPHSKPLIHPNYYTHPDDVKVMIEGARIANDLLSTDAMRALNARPNPRRNPGCEEHELMSDEHLECQARHHTLTIYHPVGTCAMGPSGDARAVVDHTLKVYGIQHLRVVDASIMPVIVNGNTNAPTIMIAEKASDMIKAEWTGEPAHEDDSCNHRTYEAKHAGRPSGNTEANSPTRIKIESKSDEDVVDETCNHFSNLIPDYFARTQPMFRVFNPFPSTTREYETKYKETVSDGAIALFPSGYYTPDRVFIPQSPFDPSGHQQTESFSNSQLRGPYTVINQNVQNPMIHRNHGPSETSINRNLPPRANVYEQFKQRHAHDEFHVLPQPTNIVHRGFLPLHDSRLVNAFRGSPQPSSYNEYDTFPSHYVQSLRPQPDQYYSYPSASSPRGIPEYQPTTQYLPTQMSLPEVNNKMDGSHRTQQPPAASEVYSQETTQPQVTESTQGRDGGNNCRLWLHYNGGKYEIVL